MIAFAIGVYVGGAIAFGCISSALHINVARGETPKGEITLLRSLRFVVFWPLGAFRLMRGDYV